MTEAARIFVSHSAADRDDGAPVNVRAYDVRVAIREALAADPRFRVLVDEVELKAGDVWRARINLWLRFCDAAVLIISPAALKSHYVAFEANILGYRKTLDPNRFRIIPVLVGVNMDDVKNSPLNPAQVSEWQTAVSGSPAEAAAGVLAGLDGVVAAGSRWENRMADELEPMLPKAVAQLRSAAEVLDVDELLWADDRDTFRLALRLLGSGMSDPCARAIRYFGDDRQFDRTALDSIGNLIAAAWVDMKAKAIPEEAQQAEPRPVLLNADDCRTAQTYMTAAKHLVQPYLKFKLVEAPFVLPESGDVAAYEQSMIDKVRAELESKFGAGPRLTAALERARKFSEGVIVVMREQSLTPALLPRLRAEFPHVLFFILGGSDAGRIAGGDLLIVQPKLADDDEKEFLDRYVTFIEDITSA